MKNRSGQLLIASIVILLVLAIILPALVMYTQNESKWTVKEQRSTKSYQLAESAVEQGYQKLLVSTGTWATVQGGTPVSGYNFDSSYTGVTGGNYQIRLAAGPSANQITITGVGKANSPSGNADVRSIKVIYTNGSAATNSISAGKLVTIGGSVNVEWGAVLSYTSIDPAGREYPRFYSAGSIVGYDENPVAPNSDNLSYWAYDSTLPSQPQVNLPFYKSQAQGQGASPVGCPNYYAAAGPGNVTSCLDNQAGGRTYYFDTGDWTWKSPGTNYVLGNIILATGNMGISGNGGTGAGPGIYSATIPPRAWEEYGKTSTSWTHYRCMDPAAPATYAAAEAADYNSVATYTIPTDAKNCVNTAGSVLLHGFIYAGGASGLSGGGNSRFHGAIITPNTATVATSNFTLYFDNTVAGNISLSSISLSRTSWSEVGTCTWAGVNATCP